MEKLSALLTLAFVSGLMLFSATVASSYAQNETLTTTNQSGAGTYNATGLEDTSAADNESGTVSGYKGR